MKRLVCLLVALLGALGHAAPGEGALEPAELFFKQPAVSEAQLSPNGTRLAVSAAAREDGRVGLFVFDLQANAKVTQAAVFRDADVREFNWLDDERLVFSVVDLKAGSGDDYQTAPGLFAVNTDGSALRALVARTGRSFVTSGERSTVLP
jgi:Tol biopolymer transport system component